MTVEMEWITTLEAVGYIGLGYTLGLLTLVLIIKVLSKMKITWRLK